MNRSAFTAMAVLFAINLGASAGDAQQVEKPKPPEPPPAEKKAVSADTARKKLEQAARELAFYGSDFNANPSPAAQKFLRENYDRLERLRNQNHDPKQLVALLKHEDPRVRTLAADLLTRQGYYKALPQMVALVKDDALTFPQPDSFAFPSGFNSKFPMLNKELSKEVVRKLSKEVVRPIGGGKTQKVGQIVTKLVHEFLMRAGYGYGVDGNPGKNNGFDDYWAKRKDRTYCASWFEMQGRNIAEINKIPEPDRSFTLLWLFGADTMSKELIVAGKKLGPEKLLRMLQHEIPSDDPDMQSRRHGNNVRYEGMMWFVLKNAAQLFRPEDASALIERSQFLSTHLWYTAAFELQPDKTKELMALGWKQLQKTKSSRFDDSLNKLAKAIWVRYGDDGQELAVKLYYHQEPTEDTDLPQINRPVPGRSRFLHEFAGEPQAARRKLVTAIVNDKRFDTLDWESLYELAANVNAWEENRLFRAGDLDNVTHPLFRGHYHWKKEFARSNYPRETAALEKALASWRHTLRKEFSVK